LNAKTNCFAHEFGLPCFGCAVTVLIKLLPVGLLTKRTDNEVCKNLHKVPKQARNKEKKNNPAKPDVAEEATVLSILKKGILESFFLPFSPFFMERTVFRRRKNGKFPSLRNH
jgi:hypothetical protein